MVETVGLPDRRNEQIGDIPSLAAKRDLAELHKPASAMTAGVGSFGASEFLMPA
jgi:hypothetical protein